MQYPRMPDEFAENRIQEAVDYLHDSAASAAKARAERIYALEYRKSLKAMLMREHDNLPLGAQEREAYADERYLEHLQAIRDAIFEDEKHQFLRAAADARIEAWRTREATLRAMRI